MKKQACVERKCLELSMNRLKSSVTDISSVRKHVPGDIGSLPPQYKRQRLDSGRMQFGTCDPDPFIASISNLAAMHACPLVRPEPSLAAPTGLPQSFQSKSRALLKTVHMRSHEVAANNLGGCPALSDHASESAWKINLLHESNHLGPSFAHGPQQQHLTPGLEERRTQQRSTAASTALEAHTATSVLAAPNITEPFTLVGPNAHVRLSPPMQSLLDRCTPLRSRRRRCGKCKQCLEKDCGTCAHCADKTRFGGKGVKKKACLNRRCIYENVSRDDANQIAVLRQSRVQLPTQQSHEMLQSSMFTSELAAMMSTTTEIATRFAPSPPPLRPCDLEAKLLQSGPITSIASAKKYRSPQLGERSFTAHANMSLGLQHAVGSCTRALKIANTSSPVSVMEMRRELLLNPDKHVQGVHIHHPTPGQPRLHSEALELMQHSLVATPNPKSHMVLSDAMPGRSVSNGALASIDANIDHHCPDFSSPDSLEVGSFLASKDVEKWCDVANWSSPAAADFMARMDPSPFPDCTNVPNLTYNSHVITGTTSAVQASTLLDESELSINSGLQDVVAALGHEDWTHLLD